MRRFRVLRTFDAQEFQSTYLEGLTYTIRDGNDRLAVAAEAWAVDQRIAFLDTPEDAGMTAQSGAAGTGTVE